MDDRRQRSATCRLSSLVRRPATRFGCGLAALWYSITKRWLGQPACPVAL